MAEEGIGLKYKLLAFMLAISIIPLGIVSYMAINTTNTMGDDAKDSITDMGDSIQDNTRDMGDSITNSTKDMRGSVVNDTEEMGQTAIDGAESMGNSALEAARDMEDESISSLNDTRESILKDLHQIRRNTTSDGEEIITNVVESSLFSKTNSTADKVSTYMRDRINNILSLTAIKDTKEAYRAYSNALVGEMFSAGLEIDQVPVLRGIYRIEADGDVPYKVGYNVSSPEDYFTFGPSEWRDISTMNINTNIMNSTLYPEEQPGDEIYNKDYMRYALRDAWSHISHNDKVNNNDKDSVYFPELTVNITGGQTRTTNLIMTSEPSGSGISDAVWMGAIPTFNETGEFDGIIVANINHLHILNINNQFEYREDSYATLSQLNDKTEDITLNAPSTYWDTYNDTGDEISASKELPNGEIVTYNEIMEDQQVGITIASPNPIEVNNYDTTISNDGAPIFAYLGNEMHRLENGILTYNTLMGNRWAAYNSVEISSEKTSNLNDLSISCVANKDIFLEPVKRINKTISDGIDRTITRTNQTINELEQGLKAEIRSLESTISSSTSEIRTQMENKKNSTEASITESINNQENTIQSSISNQEDTIDDYTNEQENNMEESVSQLRTTVLITVVVIFALVAGSAYVIADRIVSPIKELTDIADRVSQGEMDLAVEVEAHDEIGELADSFNRMINSLKIAMEQLEEEM